MDATYKVNENDYPVIFVGGIDEKQQFIAYSETSREETSEKKINECIVLWCLKPW